MKKDIWLAQLPTDFNGFNLRKMALKNYCPKFAANTPPAHNLHEALCMSFNFGKSPEGFEFWREIASFVHRGFIKPIKTPNLFEL